MEGFVSFEGRVEAGWIDANGHMNVAWYDHVFDRAESTLFDAFGVNEDYITSRQLGMFRLEKRISYQNELVEGDLMRVESHIASRDNRLLHHVHQLFNLTRGNRAAAAQKLSIHVDLDRRKSASIVDPDILARLYALTCAPSALPAIGKR